MASLNRNEKTKSVEDRDRSIVEQVDDLLECAICTEVMKNPKILPCMHSFCLECLEQYINKKTTSNSCPICRSPFPASKMISLPDNLLAKKFLEFRERMKKTSSKDEEIRRKISVQWCENCCDENDESRQSAEATKYCEQCEQSLCLQCVDAHRLLKITSKHSLTDLEIPKETISPAPALCLEHPSSKVTAYCQECLCYACQECTETDHLCHVTVDLEQFAEGLRSDASQAHFRAEHLKRMIQLTDEDKEEFLGKLAETEGVVRREADRLRVLVNDGEAELLAELESIKRKAMKKSAAYTDGAELSVLMLNGCRDRLNDLGDITSDASSLGRGLVEAERLRQETQDLLSLRQTPPYSASRGLKVVLASMDRSRGRTGSNFIGEIQHNWKEDEYATDRREIDVEEYGCEHYKRRCSFLTPCCSRVYRCRLCHDANEDHQLDRTQVRTVVCQMCCAEQPVARWCRNCDADFGRYFCAICRMYDDSDKGQFHCDKCSICRIGGRRNYWHCDGCGICISTSIKAEHGCIDGAALIDCQFCEKPIFSSREPARILPCGHFVHARCYARNLSFKRNCFICAER